MQDLHPFYYSNDKAGQFRFLQESLDPPRYHKPRKPAKKNTVETNLSSKRN